MKPLLLTALLGLTCVGCSTAPASYVGSLSPADRKWQTQACRDVRGRAANFDSEEKERLKTSAMIGLLSPSSALATANVTNQQNIRRRQFNRELHLKCSSAPLPDDLTNIPEIQPPPMLDTGRGD